MKKYLTWTLLCAIFLVPHLAFAQNVGFITFNPPDSDLSIRYLRVMFGTVPGVFSGDNTLIGEMMGIFNAGVLMLAGIVGFYTMVVGVMNTAHEGEMLGKNWSSIWIPVRTTVGIGFLLPNTTGYSFIQVFFMWVIVQGVGLADTVWSMAYKNFITNGLVISTAAAPPYFRVNQMSEMLQRLTCMYAVHNRLEVIREEAIQAERAQNSNNYSGTLNNLAIPPLVPDFTSTIAPRVDCGKVEPSEQSFPGDLSTVADGYYSAYKGVCGSVKWQLSGYCEPTFGAESENPLEQSSLLGSLSEARTLGVQEALWWLETPAQRIVSNYFFTPDTGRIELAKRTNKTYYFPLVSGIVMANAAVAYRARIQPILTRASQSVRWEPGHPAGNSDVDQGWLRAGPLYYKWAKNNRRIFDWSADPKDITFDDGFPENLKSKFEGTPLASGGYASQIIALVTNQSDPYALPTYLNAAVPYSLSQANIGGQPARGSSGKVGSPSSKILMPFSGIFFAFKQMQNAESNLQNPLVLVTYLGSSMIATGLFIFALVTALATGIAIAVSAIISFAFGTAVVAALQTVMSILTGLVGILIVTGATLAFYVPLVPYILFVSGAVAWFMAVFEAMLAAPLTALAITTPEGSEPFGMATPSVMLLVGVFLRPTLMLFGYFGGLILSYISIWVLNLGYSEIGDTLASNPGFGYAMNQLFLLVIYTSIVVMLVQKSFDLIHLIPDRVTRWIGGQGDNLAAGISDATMGAAKGATAETAQATHKAMETGGAGAAKLGQEVMDAKKAGAGKKGLGEKRPAPKDGKEK